MRFNEEAVQPKKEPKTEKKEVPQKAGTEDYDYSNLGKNKPMLGGNYNGG